MTMGTLRIWLLIAFVVTGSALIGTRWPNITKPCGRAVGTRTWGSSRR